MMREALSVGSEQDSKTVKTLCCGYKRQVPAEHIEDGKFRPYKDSQNYIECPECQEFSGLYTLNRAAVELLQHKDRKAAQSRSSEPQREEEGLNQF